MIEFSLHDSNSAMGNAAQTNEQYHFLLNKGKESVPLDGWLHDGSGAYVEGICDWEKG